MQFNPLHFTDQNGTQLQLGDTVTATKGKNKGGTYVFVFCIPQHRFGFYHARQFNFLKITNAVPGNYDTNKMPEPFVIDVPSVDFYYTPKSQKEIVKL
jgi:hypothetical protein